MRDRAKSFFIIYSVMILLLVLMALTGCKTKVVKETIDKSPINYVMVPMIMDNKCYVYKIVDKEKMKLEYSHAALLSDCNAFMCIAPSEYKGIVPYIEKIKNTNFCY